MDRLQEAFALALRDLYEAAAAVHIYNGFVHKHERLAMESEEHQHVWAFFDQGVCWKLALAVERLTQPANNDRASLLGVLREIERVQKDGVHFADATLIVEAKEELDEALKADVRAQLRDSRNVFVGHSLIGKDQKGTPVYDLAEYLPKLEAVAEKLHRGVFGNGTSMQQHDDVWSEYATSWFESMLPDAEGAEA